MLPTFTQTTIDKKTEMTTYELSLAEGPDAEGAAIKTAVMGTRSNKTNRINELPSDGYTKRDLQIFTDAGETISSLERVRVTGEMLKSGNGEPIAKPCILKVEKIERP